MLAPDLHDSLAKADQCEADFAKAVDTYIAETGIATPQETLPSLRDGFMRPLTTELDIEAANITNVIWATGYRFDFSLVKLPILDDDGYPIQTRGVTAREGLFFVGLPWLHNGKSGLIYGVGDDAAYVAKKIIDGMRRSPRKQLIARSATASYLGKSRNGRESLSVTPPHSGFDAMSVSRSASTIETAI